MGVLKRLRKLGRRILASTGYTRRSQQRRLQALHAQGLPSELREGLEFLVTGRADARTTAIADRIEARRAEIAARGSEPVPIWYSPRPGTAGDEALPELRPEPGDVLEFTMERVAITGRDRRWGTFLHLLVRADEARTVVELGACAGLSGCYLASPECVAEFMTVEGSAALAKLASESLHRVAPAGTVVNALFDEAIDRDVPGLEAPIDFVFIDGHHERIATIHYYERLVPYLAPSAIVVFDDIAWSADMNAAWKELAARPEFRCAIDLGPIGVCFYDPSSVDEPTRYWDLQTVLGRTRIGTPHGWNRD